MGIYLGSGIAMIVGGFITGWTSHHADWIVPVIGPVRGWQMVFFAVGFPGLLLALLMFTVKEPVRRGLQAGAASPPLRDVFAWVKKERATFLCHNLGIALITFSSYGSTAWLPTFFIRHHHWSAAHIGKSYGSLTAVFGALGVACGGWAADRLMKRGYRDACMRLAAWASLLWIPSGVGALLVSDPNLALALLAPSIFFAAAPLGIAPAAIMQVSPASMRGRTGALYLFAINLIGLGAGPTAVALVTDYFFHDDSRVGASLLIVALAAHLLAWALLQGGLKPYVRTLDALESRDIATPVMAGAGD